MSFLVAAFIVWLIFGACRRNNDDYEDY